MDELTGLPGRSELTDALAGVPEGQWIAAIFVDIDEFRMVNFELGHVEGDAALVTVARAIESRGKTFRVGGDEFLLLLPGMTLAQAASIANALVGDPPANITLSAVVFAADRDLSAQLPSMLDGFAHSLYLAEIARGRRRSNVVVCD